VVLQAFGKDPQAPVEACRIIPKRCVPRIRHHVNLRVSHARFVLVDDGWFDNRVISAMRNQYRLADPGQEIIIIERAREQRLTDIGRDGQIVSQHQVHICG